MKVYPTPEEIKQARLYSNLTRKQAAELIYHSERTWENWEQGRPMHPAIFELFLMKIGKLL